MKNVLLIAEKNFQSFMICQGLYENGVIDDNTTIDTICVMGFSWWRFKVPSRISMASIPFSETPGMENLEPSPLFTTPSDHDPDINIKRPLLSQFDGQFSHEGYVTNDKGERYVSKARMIYQSRIDDMDKILETVAGRIDSYDQIIVAPDSDHSGWSSAFRWISKLEQHIKAAGVSAPFMSPARNIRAMWLGRGLDVKSVFESYSENTGLEDPKIQKLRAYGDAKRVFDYWWAYNSAAVFSKLQKHVGISEPIILSKYQLLMLHLLNQWGKPISKGALFHGMSEWLGTGKYRANHTYSAPKAEGFHSQCLKMPLEEALDETKEEVWGSIGSPTSVSAIIEDLKKIGLLASTPCKEGARFGDVSISEQGREFLSYCHKSMFDPDLPFRISIWCQNQEYDKMGKYIRTVFGKQKRYLSKQIG